MTEPPLTSAERYNFSARVREADTEEAVLSLFSEALRIKEEMEERDDYPDYDYPGLCCNIVMEEAQVLTPPVLHAFRRHSPFFYEVLQRADLPDEPRQFIMDETWRALESVRNGDEEDPWRDLSTLGAAVQYGLAEEDMAMRERLWPILETACGRASGKSGRQDQGYAVFANALVLTMLRCGEWDAASLERMASIATPFLEPDAIEQIATHDEARLDLWLILARSHHQEERVLEPILAQIPEARNHPTIRARLLAGPKDAHVLAGLCMEGGSEVRPLFRELAAHSPNRATQLVEDPDFAGIRELTREDLLPLLSSEHARHRLSAIAALARLEGAVERTPLSAAQEETKRSAWRERFVSTSFPF